MCPLRPTAIATPGATASSIDVLTILLSLPRSAVSSPELLRPSSGSMYLTGVGDAATILAAGGGGAQAATATTDMTARTEDFMRLMGTLCELRTRVVFRRNHLNESGYFRCKHLEEKTIFSSRNNGQSLCPFPPYSYLPGARMQFLIRSPAAAESARVVRVGQGGGTALVSDRCPPAATERTAAQPSSS